MRLPGLVVLAAMTLPASAGAEHAWSVAVSGGSAELLGVWGSSKTDVYAVSREGAVLHSTDGGHAWTARTIDGAAANGGLVSVYGRDENTVYAAGGALVLRSTDHGATWTTVFTGTAEDKLAGVFAAGGSEVFAVGAKGTIVHSADSGSTCSLDSTSWARKPTAKNRPKMLSRAVVSIRSGNSTQVNNPPSG